MWPFTSKKKLAIKDDITGLNMDQFAQMFANPSYTGVDVTPESASRAIPVQACCSLISGGITSMPLQIAQRQLVSGKWLQTPADDHPYWWFFNETPDGEISAAQFWRRAITHKLLFGESFARIIRKNGGRSIDIAAIVFTPNRQVMTLRTWDPVERRAKISGYKCSINGHTFGVLPEDMLHFKDAIAMNSLNQQSGVAGVVSAAQMPVGAILDATRQAIGIVLAIEEYCGRIFSNGGTPKVILKYPAGVNLKETQIQALRDMWVRKYGGADQAGLPAVLNNGGDVTKLSYSSEELQLLEARKFQVIDIARGFSVPPFMIGETEKTSSWGSGIEQMSQAFIRYTLATHISELEQETTRKLFTSSKYCTDFDEEALSRGDMKSLGDWFRQALGGAQGPGFMTTNEVRRRMNLSAIADGDEVYNPAEAADETEGDGNEQPAETAGTGGGKQGDGASSRRNKLNGHGGDHLPLRLD